MKLRYRDILIYVFSILFFIIFIYFIINDLQKKPYEIINFIDSDINGDFEVEITNNLHDINNFLKEYSFIESFIFKRKNNEINIRINLKESFAKNNFTKEVIFYDNIKAPLYYFKPNYLNNIKLLDISKKSIHINNYLNQSYETLTSLFNIDQIEYIDDRRYNLILDNGKVVMLPKVIDSKLLYFIGNNIELIENSTNYQQFLDLRNFHKKTIRLK